MIEINSLIDPDMLTNPDMLIEIEADEVICE